MVVRMCRILARFEKIMLGKMQCNLAPLQLPKIETTFGRKLLLLGKALGHSLSNNNNNNNNSLLDMWGHTCPQDVSSPV